MKLSLPALTIACIISSPLFCAQQPQKSLVSSPQTAFSSKLLGQPFPKGHDLALTIRYINCPARTNMRRITTSDNQTLRTLKRYIAKRIVCPEQATLHIEIRQGFKPISLDDKSPYTLDELAIAESPELWVSIQESAAPQRTGKN